MTTNKTAKPTWAAIRKHLKDLEPEALLSLIQDLHDISPANRDFLQARTAAAAGDGAALESYRKRVIEPFYPARGEAKLKLGEARKAIRDYHKATGDATGTIELLLTYSEAGAEFTNEFGDIDERFYDSLCSAMDDLAARIRRVGATAWGTFSDRLEKLVSSIRGIGWGYHDHLAGALAELEDHFADH
ncbi:MAG: hypothetical protein JNM65_05720 [Verrucomicrobiaceae bacterium]|nr:hypothetical protein [Verrucomicrobiaceae bacterium]